MRPDETGQQFIDRMGGDGAGGTFAEPTVMNRLGRSTETLMRMNDAAWERHANPWSVWTRVAVMPLLAASAWSRLWIGWWFLIPTALIVVWIWLNPRVFARPKSLTSWASRGVMGERIWLTDDPETVAAHHHRVIRVLILISGLGGLIFVGGLLWLHLTATLVGLALTMLAKLWFLDRMVWIQREKESIERPRQDATAGRN